MLVTSPLVDLLSGPADMNPWQETVSAQTLSYDSSLQLLYPPKLMTAGFNPSNAREVYDLSGNIRQETDGWRKSFKFTWSADWFTSAEQIWKLYRLLADPYPKQLYPLGIGESLITSTTGTLATVGGELQLTPSAQVNPLQPHHWSGFWVGLFDSLYNYYYIRDNTSSYFVLEDKFGCGLADDDYGIMLDYILVHARLAQTTFGQPNGFTSFLEGGKWEEFDPTTEDHEYTEIEISFVEVENPEDQ